MSIKQLASIKIDKVKDSSDLYSLEDEISFVSPFMRVAFVENTKYGQLYFKLEFTDMNKNETMNKFHKLIYTVEQIFYSKICHLLNLNNCILSSQIYKKANSTYNPLLTVKIPKNKKKKCVTAQILNSDNRTFYDIQRNEVVRVKIVAKYIWNNKKKMTLRWNIKELTFRDDEEDKQAEDKQAEDNK